jgi:hypothetical protein
VLSEPHTSGFAARPKPPLESGLGVRSWHLFGRAKNALQHRNVPAAPTSYSTYHMCARVSVIRCIELPAILSSLGRNDIDEFGVDSIKLPKNAIFLLVLIPLLLEENYLWAAQFVRSIEHHLHVHVAVRSLILFEVKIYISPYGGVSTIDARSLQPESKARELPSELESEANRVHDLKRRITPEALTQRMINPVRTAQDGCTYALGLKHNHALVVTCFTVAKGLAFASVSSNFIGIGGKFCKCAQS